MHGARLSVGAHLKMGGVAVLIALMLGGCGGAPSPRTPSYSASPPVGPSHPQRVQVVKEPLKVNERPRTVVHEVAPLETVWRLSKMYGVPMDDIYRANGLRPGAVIRIGQKLIIPNARYFQNVVPLYPNTCWRYIVIHHTATDIGNASLIHSNHQKRGFWNGLGYHFLIDNGSLGKGDGQIEVAPRWIKQKEGAHCKVGNMNEQGIGIALVGDFNQALPTPRQMESLARLVRELVHYYHIPPSHILGHGDVPGANTDCPGKRFPWNDLQRRLVGLN